MRCRVPQGAKLLEQAKAEEAARAEDGAKGDAAGGDDGAKQPAAARVGQEERTIGKPSRWVADVEAIESPSAAARTELSRKLDTARGLVTRLLQSVYHTLHALQTLSAGPEARAPPLSALELRHLADAITGALPVLALGRAGPATTSPNALCAPRASPSPRALLCALEAESGSVHARHRQRRRNAGA